MNLVNLVLAFEIGACTYRILMYLLHYLAQCVFIAFADTKLYQIVFSNTRWGLVPVKTSLSWKTL